MLQGQPFTEPTASSRGSPDESVRNCNCVTRTHGGLTPAALVKVRFCIAKIVILSADGRRNRTKSGGRKPPVGNKTPLQIATAFLQPSACVRQERLV
jgi:hypothetical protein